MTRQLVREGEGRARQEINNIERQVFIFDSPAASSAREIYFWLLGAWSVRARLTFECRCHNWEIDVAANW